MASAEVNLRATLLEGLEALGLPLDDAQIDQLLSYQALIAKWTQVYNLTAVRDPAEMMTHHLLDSLAAVPALQRHLRSAGLAQASRLLDVGSGAGLPGVVMAVCCPAVKVTCVDTVAKKAAFIKQAALALKLPNLTGLHARVESISQPHDVICSRAFASLADFTQWSAGALAPDGVWMAMKGKQPTDEVNALPENIELFHVEQLQVPGLQAERCILWLRPVA
ncbi:MAG: rRNA m(7)G-527 methyltransferase [Polaromonas sp.]|nr:rRNA m(7)G-527 methyltransferase [Polaromonas sp.]